MELLIKQRVFAWSDTYDVYDGNGNPRYYVRGEILSLGHQIHVYRHDTGEEVGSIRQRLLTLLPRFDVRIGGREVGTVSREFSLFVPSYHVDYLNWSVEGDLFSWNYQVYQGSREVMSIEKEWLTWGDTYVLRFSDPGFELPGLMLVLAIDAANCGND